MALNLQFSCLHILGAKSVCTPGLCDPGSQMHGFIHNGQALCELSDFSSLGPSSQSSYFKYLGFKAGGDFPTLKQRTKVRLPEL